MISILKLLRLWIPFGDSGEPVETENVGQVVRLRAAPTEIALIATPGGPVIAATWGYEEP